MAADHQGLTGAEAAQRLAAEGYNELPAAGPRAIWKIALASAVLVLGLPLAARLSRVGDTARCATDGAEIAPEYRARLVETGGANREFCGVACATTWLAHSPGFAALFVTVMFNDISRNMQGIVRLVGRLFGST